MLTEDVIYYLYLIRLPISDYAPAYVGVTKCPTVRFKDHRCKKVRANPIAVAIASCGATNAVFEIVETGGRDYIYSREIELIATLNTLWPNGYNIARGGLFGRDPLPSTRAKISASNRGKKLSAESLQKWFKRKHSQETREKMSLSQLGHPGCTHSPETLARISQALKGRKLPSERVAKSAAARTGSKRSSETCARISAAMKGRKQSPETRAKMMGRKLSPETRAKMAAAHTGKRHSPERIAKMSGWKHSPEAIAKSTAARIGTKMSLESRARMSIAQQARQAKNRIVNQKS